LAVLIPSYQTAKARLLEMVGRRWFMYSPPEHLCLYSRQFLDRFLASKGFRLERRCYTTGGWNPCSGVRIFRGAVARMLRCLDTHWPFYALPVFDHMYSYYQKR
jgi:hypothetical protein